MSEDDLKFSLCGPLNKKMTKKLHRQCSVLHGRCRWNQKGSKTTKTFKKKEKSGDSFAHRHIGGSCVTHRCAWAAVVFHFCFSHPFIRRTATRFQTCDATTRQLRLITKTPTWTAPCWPFLSSFYWHQVRPPFGFRTSVTKRASNTNCEKRRRERERKKKFLKYPRGSIDAIRRPAGILGSASSWRMYANAQ